MTPRVEKTCPVIPKTLGVLRDVRHLAVSLRSLRKAMRRCSDCDLELTCPAIIEFNQAFSTAIQEVMEEWGVTAY